MALQKLKSIKANTFLITHYLLTKIIVFFAAKFIYLVKSEENAQVIDQDSFLFFRFRYGFLKGAVTLKLNFILTYYFSAVAHMISLLSETFLQSRS